MAAASSDNKAPPLPPKFHTIEDSFGVPEKNFVNVIGIVKDYQPPFQTGGEDAKCTIELVDPSVHDQNGIKVNFFTPMSHMPKSVSVGDLIVLRQFKVQHKGGISLLSNYSSEFHILKASEVPCGPVASPDSIHWEKIGKPGKKVFNRPNAEELAYAVWIHGKSDTLELPSEDVFRNKADLACYQRGDKFKLLKDVRPDAHKPFYNIIGQVLRKHNDGNGCLTIHFSDYTPNSLFYNRVKGDSTDEPQDGQTWEGPWGKMSMQISMFDQNADYMTELVDVNNWVLLKNVKIERRAYDYLEGRLHTDGSKILVELLNTAKDSNVDARLKDALRRKLEYVQAQKKKLLGKKEGLDGKRKANGDESEKSNSKKRRLEKRAAAVKLAAVKDEKLQQKLNLNENIRCAHSDQPNVPFAEILKQVILKDSDNQVHIAPFTNRKYKALVRVVDYFPQNIKDFARQYPENEREFAALSDYSGDDDDDDEDTITKTDPWEWRFALQVEDTNKERMWLLLDNMSAQGLLNIEALERADNLRKNKRLLNTLKDQLFRLWGELEEQKSATLPSEENIPPSTMDSMSSRRSSPLRKPGGPPNADDSDDEYTAVNPKPPALNEISPNIRKEIDEKATNNLKDEIKLDLKLKNKPFMCCIRQYGVKVEEEDAKKADAGIGERWQRMFGLFDTTIIE